MVDELERLLGEAISDEVENSPVEVTGLVSGAHHGARRIRRRRVVGTVVASALLVAAVPIAGGALSGPPPAQQVAASPTATTPTPSTSPSASAAVPAPPTASPVNPDVPEGLAGTVLVRPEALVGPADLPFTPVTTDDFGPYVKNRTLTTSLCGDGAEPGDDLSVGGRQITYAGESQDFAAAVVRVFGPGGAQQQLDFLRDSLGTCDYAGVTYAPQDAAGLPGDEALIGTAPSGLGSGRTTVVGAIRAGATTTGVQLDVGGDEAAATALARDLLTRAHERLVASGLPAAHP